MSFPVGEDASAVVLTVQFVLFGQFCGTFVAVTLFKIIGEPVDSILGGKLLTDLIELFRVLQRTDRQGCGNIVTALFFCRADCFCKSETVAGKAPFTAFWNLFHPFSTMIKVSRNIIPLQKIYWITGRQSPGSDASVPVPGCDIHSPDKYLDCNKEQ